MAPYPDASISPASAGVSSGSRLQMPYLPSSTVMSKATPAGTGRIPSSVPDRP
jgi:hypothetical protein